MPFKIAWLDKSLHIYDIVLSDPFTLQDQDNFFTNFFQFMDAAPVPMFGLFDLSYWSQTGAAGLNDPRFKRMGNYHNKIVVIVMVTKNRVAAAMGQLGAAVAGYRDWIRFEESRETAIKYLTTRATRELTQKGLLPQKPTPQESETPLQQRETPKKQKPRNRAPKI